MGVTAGINAWVACTLNGGVVGRRISACGTQDVQDDGSSYISGLVLSGARGVLLKSKLP